jgi:hypothetical protein
MAESINYIGTMKASKLGGPIEQYSMTQFTAGAKLLSTTHDVAVTGDQAITGAGFKPSGGVIMVTVDDTLAASWGLFDSSKTIGALNANRSDAAGKYQPDTMLGLYLGSGNAASFIIKSLDADGLTITWTKYSSPTGTATIKLLLFR